MKQITVLTKKVVSHDANKQAIYEEIKQELQPEMTWLKFLKYLPIQEYVSVKVIEVIENDGSKGDMKVYQQMIDEKLNEKPETNIDYKAKAEKQEKQIADLMMRLENLEKKSDNDLSKKSKHDLIEILSDLIKPEQVDGSMNKADLIKAIEENQ